MKHILPSWLSLNRITWIFVIFFILLSIWQLWYYMHDSTVSETTTISNFTPNSGRLINRTRINKSPYFGQYLPEDGSGIQQTNLDIILVGVLYSEDPTNSQVIVRQSDREEKFYHIDDTLPGGSVVKKITEDSVIILFDGKLQRLSLPKDSLSFEAKPKALLVEE